MKEIPVYRDIFFSSKRTYDEIDTNRKKRAHQKR